jgi:hypothetical protein
MSESQVIMTDLDPKYALHPGDPRDSVPGEDGTGRPTKRVRAESRHQHVHVRDALHERRQSARKPRGAVEAAERS